MEHKSNEEKAKEIATKWKAEGLPYSAIYDTALEAMQWKDKEWAERFKNAFEGLWTASINVDNRSSVTETTIVFKLKTTE